MSYPTRPDGGPAVPVSISDSALTQGGVAIPVYGYTELPADRPVLGMPAIPVKVLTDADLIQNGGTYRVEGRPYAMPVYTAPSGLAESGGEAIAVYPVNPDDWPNPNLPPANWWEAGGATGCIAAYQPKGAASLAASYVNLANPGTFDAYPGVAPTWNATDGWVGEGSSYLRTGITTLSGTWTVLCQYTNMSIGNNNLFGIQTAAGLYRIRARDMFASPVNGTNFRNQGGAGTTYTTPDTGAAANVGIAGKKVLVNGLEVGTDVLTVPCPELGIELFLMNINQIGNPQPGYYIVGCISALVVYNNTLDASQFLAVATAMAAL